MASLRVILVSLFTGAASQMLLNAGSASKSTVARALESEFNSVDAVRLSRFEDALRTTFRVLPKNRAGNLGHEAVRYALHRMFIQRHGWFIKGLEPGSDKLASNSTEWIPSYLQSMLEQRIGEKGATLHDVAAFAAALEDLIDSEARGRLGSIFETLGMDASSPVSAEQARKAIKAYFISFLQSGDFVTSTQWEVEKELVEFPENYEGWESAEAWLNQLLDPKFSAKPSNVYFSFDEVARMAEDVGENYFKFNDVECRDLKGMLSGLEGIKAGRVRLSFFYQKGLHSHWNFNEKPDYLRVMGALDDSDANMPQVIVPNYVMARTNCLDSSGLYAICCRNECEDLMNSLEAQIGSASTHPKRIVDIVSGMSSDTVKAPRALSSALLTRLDEVAVSNGGQVPLHGRLFAQWMHHAFPRECPYPHEAGVNPQTPDEWMASQPEGAKKMTVEEMEKTVQADQCASGLTLGRLPRPEDCEGSSGSDLPWTPFEALLSTASKPTPLEVSAKPPMIGEENIVNPSKGANDALSFGVVHAVCVIGLVVCLSVQGYRMKCGQIVSKLEDDDVKYKKPQAQKINTQAVAVFTVLAVLAFLLDLMDATVFGCAVLGAIGSVVIHQSAKEPFCPCDKDDIYSKCAV